MTTGGPWVSGFSLSIETNSQTHVCFWAIAKTSSMTEMGRTAVSQLAPPLGPNMTGRDATVAWRQFDLKAGTGVCTPHADCRLGHIATQNPDL